MRYPWVLLLALSDFEIPLCIDLPSQHCHPTPEHKRIAVSKFAEYNEAATKKPQFQTDAIQ